MKNLTKGGAAVHSKDILSILAGFLCIFAFAPYIRAILRKEAKPEKTTWIIWASLDAIALAGMHAKHTVNGLIVGAAIGAGIVAILALKYGTPGWTRLDKFCFGGAILGVVAWKAYGNPMFGLITSLTLMLAASVPTFVSAWKDPSKEDRTAWTIFWVSCVVAMFAIPAMTLADVAQPTTFLLIESIIVFILYVRPWLLAHAT